MCLPPLLPHVQTARLRGLPRAGTRGIVRRRSITPLRNPAPLRLTVGGRLDTVPAMDSLIGHLDADCFYVSAERARFPHLRGVPAGVIGNQGACVIAKSYELKAAGVTTGMPIWEAFPLCPEAVFLKRDFRWYEVLSRKMLATLQAVINWSISSARPL
jgi:hypothetical protein